MSDLNRILTTLAHRVVDITGNTHEPSRTRAEEIFNVIEETEQEILSLLSHENDEPDDMDDDSSELLREEHDREVQEENNYANRMADGE